MALETTQSSGLSVQYQAYFSKRLLKHAVQLLVMDQFATKSPFPRNAGATQIKFFRADVGSRANVQSLSEGVPITVFRDTTLTPVTFTMVQYGEAIKISDILTYTDLYSSLDQGIQSMGEDAALHADFIVTSAVVPNVAAANKHYSGGAATFNALNALTAAQGAMTITDLLWATTRLTIARAPYAKGGVYVAMVPPQLAFDLMQDAKFVDSGKYGSFKGLFNGEIGMWYGVRIVQTTQPWTEAGTNGTEGTFGTGGVGGTIYSTIVTGGDAYGTPILSGQSPYDPKVMINDKPAKSDPLNQFITAGWKTYYAAGLLNDTWVVVNRSKTTFA
jgi:N4-gp56 family major capsid protein